MPRSREQGISDSAPKRQKSSSFMSYQRAEPAPTSPSSSGAREIAATSPATDKALSSKAYELKDYNKAVERLQKRPTLSLKDAVLTPIVGQRTWLLVENYEAQLWKDEPQEGRTYFGAFAILSHPGTYAPESLPLVYDPEQKSYGIVTGELLIHSNDINKDCKESEFEGHKISSCFAHLSFFTVTLKTKNVADIFTTATDFRRISGINSVKVEILSQFQEPM